MEEIRGGKKRSFALYIWRWLLFFGTTPQRSLFYTSHSTSLHILFSLVQSRRASVGLKFELLIRELRRSTSFPCSTENPSLDGPWLRRPRMKHELSVCEQLCRQAGAPRSRKVASHGAEQFAGRREADAKDPFAGSHVTDCVHFHVATVLVVQFRSSPSSSRERFS